MHPQSETSCTPLQRVGRWLRRQSPWLLALAIVLCYPLLRTATVDYIAQQAPAQDQAAVADQVGAQWVRLTGPASKLLLAVLAFGLELGIVWLAMRFVTPVLNAWARGRYLADGTNDAADFKYTFLHLSRAAQIAVFMAGWLGLLFNFGLLVLGFCLVQ